VAVDDRTIMLVASMKHREIRQWHYDLANREHARSSQGSSNNIYERILARYWIGNPESTLTY
jgi:hypothetical protein